MTKTATMVAWNRPEYFEPVIESLSKNDWYDYKLFIQLEPSEPDIQQKMLDICKSIDFVPTDVHVNRTQLGVNFNNYYLIERMIKEEGSEFNIHLEEDVKLSPDAIKMAEWFYNYEKRDDYLFCVFRQDNNDLETPLKMNEVKKFHPWGWCFNTQKWTDHIKPRWKDYQGKFRNGVMRREGSWDFSVNWLIKDNPQFKALMPAVSRAEPIGQWGIFSNPTTFAQNHAFKYINNKDHEGEFHV